MVSRRPRRAAPASAVAPLAVAAVALVLIRGTLQPGVAFWDTAEFQVLGPVMGTGHAPGYPTYAILGWVANLLLAPFGEPAFRMNLFSALCVAAAAGVIVVLVRRLTGSTVIGIAAGLGLATTPLAWRLGTHAEGHTLHLLFLAILFVELVWWQRERRAGGGDRFLVAAAITFGISYGNHSLTLLLAPAIGLYVLAVDPWIWKRWRFVLGCAAAVLGSAALVHLELPLRAGPFRAPLVYGTPHTWEGFWYVVTAEQFQGAIVNPFADLGRKFGDLVQLTIGEFGALAALIPVGLLATIVREPRYALLSGLALLVTVFFSASYINADIIRYYLGPVLIAWTWLGILGATAADQVMAIGGDRTSDDDGQPAGDGSRRTGTPARHRPSATGLAAAVLAAAVLLTPTVLDLPERHDDVDESRDTGAQAWLDTVLTTVGPNAAIVSWWSYSTPLWYAQHVEGRRPDIRIIDDRTRLDENLGELENVIELSRAEGRPVYLIRADNREIARLSQQYHLQPLPGNASNVLEVVAPLGAAG
jgi:hypothetical protein